MGTVFTKMGRIRRKPSSVNIRRPPAPTRTETEGSSEGTLHQPQSELLGRLKDVYVSSSVGTVTHDNTYGADRKPSNLPQERRAHDVDPLDDPDSAPLGYLTTKDFTFILQQQAGASEKDPSPWTPEVISQKYGISLEDSENLLRYFIGFRVVGTIKAPPETDPEIPSLNPPPK